jgi:hypothetical protein
MGVLLGNGKVLGDPDRNCCPINLAVVPTIKARLVVLSDERAGAYAKVEGRGELSE